MQADASSPRVSLPSQANIVDVDATDAAMPVRLHPGQLLRVHLRESQATGYRWEVQAQLPPSLRLEAEPGARIDQRDDARTWSFRVLAADVTRLQFDYRRGWDGATDPAQALTFDLHIH